MKHSGLCAYILLSLVFVFVNLITLDNLPPWIDEVMMLDTSYNAAIHGAWETTAWYRVAGQHPVKRTRPIACGSVSKQTGYVVMMVLWVGAFSLAALTYACCNKMQIGLICTLLFYIAMNVAYCVRLKHVALLDVFIGAIGFVLRIIAGGQVGGIALSHWIVITTFSLALFLAVAKRRDDMALYDASGIKTRKSLSGYNIDFLNLCIGVLGCITIMCYILYTVSTEIIERIGNYHLYITSLFVLAAILRYIQLTLVEHKSGSPTKLLLRDHFIHVCIFGWILAFTFILYL